MACVVTRHLNTFLLSHYSLSLSHCTLGIDNGAIGPVVSATPPSELTASSPPPKRNRCFTCRKKVGLTGKTLSLLKYYCIGWHTML